MQIQSLFSWVQFSWVTQLCPTLCDPMNRSTPGLSVHHQLPEFTDSRPLSQWCHPAISSSVVPFSSCPQSLPASGSFPMSQVFAWGGQSTGVSASASFPPKKSQGWSPSEWTGWISLQSKGLSRVFSNKPIEILPVVSFSYSLQGGVELVTTVFYRLWTNKQTNRNLKHQIKITLYPFKKDLACSNF